MKFSSETIEVLNNFSSINPSIVFRTGDVLKTMAPTKGCVAYANIPDSIPSEFAIYDLRQFLNVISLFSEPEYTILDKNMVISEGKESVNYVFASPDMVITPPESDEKLKAQTSEGEVKFELTSDNLKKIMKAATTLSVDAIRVVGENDEVFVEAYDMKNSSNNLYRLRVGDTDRKFKMTFLLDNFKMLNRDYQVSISSKGISSFAASDITYYIVAEAKFSKFE